MKTNAEVVKVVHKGTFKENSRAIYNYLKVPEIEIDDKEVTSHDNYVFEENFVDKVSEDRAEKSEGIKLLFVGTFLENYEDILESINKFVNNGREDADVGKEKLFNGNEIKEKDSKCEGSRYELEPVDGRKTHEDKVDVHHKHFARDSSPRHYINLTMLNPMLSMILKSSCVVSGQVSLCQRCYFTWCPSSWKSSWS